MRGRTAAFFLPFALAGCATAWPDLPSTTYSGTVINAPLGTPEPNAKITAIRPGLTPGLGNPFFLLMPVAESDETIGFVHSGSDGRFTLTTRTGYATKIVASSPDDRLDALLDHDLKHGNRNLTLQIVPDLQCISYRMVNLSTAETNLLRSAFNKILFQYAATNYRSTKSLAADARSGLLSPDEFALLQRLKNHLLGAHPDIEAQWSDVVLRIDSFETPVWFKSSHSPFPGIDR